MLLALFSSTSSENGAKMLKCHSFQYHSLSGAFRLEFSYKLEKKITANSSSFLLQHTQLSGKTKKDTPLQCIWDKNFCDSIYI